MARLPRAGVAEIETFHWWAAGATDSGFTGVRFEADQVRFPQVLSHGWHGYTGRIVAKGCGDRHPSTLDILQQVSPRAHRLPVAKVGCTVWTALPPLRLTDGWLHFNLPVPRALWEGQEV